MLMAALQKVDCKRKNGARCTVEVWFWSGWGCQIEKRPGKQLKNCFRHVEKFEPNGKFEAEIGKKQSLQRKVSFPTKFTPFMTRQP